MSTSTSTNYTGRVVDLSLYPNISSSDTPVEGNADTSRAIAGKSKVAQNFVRILLTPLGTYRAHPTLGSNFMARIKAGFVKYDVDLLHLFAGESLNVLEFMGNNAPSNAPKDELISKVSLTTYTARKGRFDLAIELTTQAGDISEFLLPVIWNN